MTPEEIGVEFGNAGSPPVSIGPFRLTRTLGSGGSSSVYLGERTDGFAQRVAIKVLRDVAVGEAEGVEEIDRERGMLASLEHPAIVRLLDQGTFARGQRYLVMEYVDGQPIDVFCDAARLPLEERIGQLRKVMAGVSYAHRHLVVHADIKPANILVTAEGQPKLLDFGVAAMLEREIVPGVTGVGATSAAASRYTPAFASPEQRAGGAVLVMSDVYSLGVVAAVLLAGINPAPGAYSEGMAASELLRRMDEPARSRIAAARATTAAALEKRLRGDLEAILGKAMEADPEARYLTVEEMSEDLGRYVEGWPIHARPVTPLRRARKWVGRHRALAAVALVLAVAIGLSVVGGVWKAAQAARARTVAQARLQELVRLTGVLDGELFASATPLAHSEDARNTLLQGATQTLDEVATGSGGEAALAVELAREYGKLARLQMTLAGPAHRAQAVADVDKGLVLLRGLPSRERDTDQVQKVVAELTGLQRAAD